MPRARSLLRSALLAALAGALASNSSCRFKSETDNENDPPEGTGAALAVRVVALPALPPLPVRLVAVEERPARR